MNGWLVAIRLARREIRRSLGLSALIMTMVALPVAGLTAVVLVGQSSIATVEESAAVELGANASMVVSVFPPNPGMTQNPFDPRRWESNGSAGSVTSSGVVEQVIDPLPLLPAGTEVLSIRSSTVTAETATGIAQFGAIVGESWNPSFAGRFDVVDGVAPAASDEIMANSSALEHLGASVGDTVILTQPEDLSLTISGEIDDRYWPDSEERLFLPEGMLPASDVYPTGHYLPELALDWPTIQELNKQGIGVLSRAVVDDPPAGATPPVPSIWVTYGLVILMGAGFAIFEVMLLAGAAFTVGARRQQRALATVASVGGTPSTLVRIVAAQGLVQGFGGALVGVLLGIGAGSVFMELTRNGSSTQYWGYHLDLVALAVIVLSASVVGLLAALIPARNAAKVDVLAALRGARKPARPHRAHPRIGMVLIAVGALLLFGGIAAIYTATNIDLQARTNLQIAGAGGVVLGAVAIHIGVILCLAMLLRLLARALGRMGLSARLASRDSAATPSRTVPAIAAVMVTAFIGVLVMNIILSSAETSSRFYQYQSMPGTVSVALTGSSDVSGAPAADQDAIVDTLQNTLEPATVDVLDTATVWSAPVDDGTTPDATTTEPTADGEAPDELVPEDAVTIWPVTPPEGFCPLDPESSDFDPGLDPADPDDRGTRDRLARDPRCEINTPRFWDNTTSPLFVLDVSQLEHILDRVPSDAAVDMLESGGAVALRSSYVADGEATIGWWSPEQTQDLFSFPAGTSGAGTPDLKSETIPAVVDEPEHPLPYGMVITPQTAERLGITHATSRAIAVLDDAPSTANLDAATAALAATGSQGGYFPYYEAGPDPTGGPAPWGVLGACALLFIGASAVAIGLSRADGRQDDATLAAVGATRLLRRNRAFWQAVIIVWLGALAGTLIALLVTWTFSIPIDGMPFVPPWLHLGLLVVGAPLAIAAASWLTASKPVTLARRSAIA